MPELSKTTSSFAAPFLSDKSEGYAAWMGANSAFIEALTQASQTYMSQFSALNEEMLGFAAGRMQKNSEIGEQLMKCKDLSDALRIQQDWIRQTAENYLQEAGKIFEMTTKAAMTSVNPMIEQATNTAQKAAEKADELRRAS